MPGGGQASLSYAVVVDCSKLKRAVANKEISFYRLKARMRAVDLNLIWHCTRALFCKIDCRIFDFRDVAVVH